MGKKSNSSSKEKMASSEKFVTPRKMVKRNSESLKSGDGRQYKKISRPSRSGRAVSIRTILSEVFYRRLRISKRIMNPLIDEALNIAKEALLEENIDLVYPGLGTIESEVLDTRPFYHSKSGITTWFPPGSVKLRFKPQKRIRALARPKMMHELANGWQVYPWYSHLYRKDGTPNIDSDEWFDRESVKIYMFQALGSVRDRKNKEPETL